MKDKRILIIDDNLGDLKLMEEALRELGYEDISLADNGKMGIVKAKLLKPDLVIIDMHLPDMNGILACRAIKLFANIQAKVISITGIKNSPYAEEFAELEDDSTLADRYLEKTADCESLKGMVQFLV